MDGQLVHKITYRFTGQVSPPAPDAVLNMISCACTKSKCVAGGCSCLSVRVKCTDLCKCKNFENTPDESGDSDEKFDEDEIDTDSSDALEWRLC